MIIHGQSNSTYCYGIICTINGTAITKAQASTQLFTLSTMQITVYNENKVFIAHAVSTYLYGIMCIIDNNNQITTTLDTQLSNMENSAQSILIRLLNNNKILIIYTGNYDTNAKTYYLYAMICQINISDDNIIIVNNIQLSDISMTSIYASMQINISNTNRIYITHNHGNASIYILILQVNDAEINIIADTTLSISSYSLYPIILNNNKVAIIYRYRKCLFGWKSMFI